MFGIIFLSLLTGIIETERIVISPEEAGDHVGRIVNVRMRVEQSKRNVQDPRVAGYLWHKKAETAVETLTIIILPTADAHFDAERLKTDFVHLNQQVIEVRGVIEIDEYRKLILKVSKLDQITILKDNNK